jgi:hypothetical protein
LRPQFFQRSLEVDTCIVRRLDRFLSDWERNFNGRFAPEAVMPFSFAVTFRFEMMGTRGRLTDYHVSAKNSRGGPAETDL